MMTKKLIHGFDQEVVDLVSRGMMKGAPPDAVTTFLLNASRSGLDPFARQIYCLRRRGRGGDTWSTQTSIDGFRSIAARSRQYAGQLGPFWCGSDGQWQEVWLSDSQPVAARVGVLRHDFKEPLWAVARFKAYAQGGPMWAKMPDLMIGKVAEALALRRAFPQELSGLYTSDEMEQAGVQPLPAREEEPDVEEKQPDFTDILVNVRTADEMNELLKLLRGSPGDIDRADMWKRMLSTAEDLGIHWASSGGRFEDLDAEQQQEETDA